MLHPNIKLIEAGVYALTIYRMDGESVSSEMLCHILSGY